jgi:hypothetical protein
MWSGNYIFISVIITIIAVFSPWIYLCGGLWVNKRWVYSMGINPNNPQEPLPPLIAFPTDVYLIPSIILLFPRIASNMTHGFFLFVAAVSGYVLNYIFVKSYWHERLFKHYYNEEK